MSTADEMAQIEDELTLEIIRSARLIDAVYGSKPLDAERMNKDEQVEDYMKMRDDAQVWRDLLTRRGPVPTVKYARKMEELLRGLSIG